MPSDSNKTITETPKSENKASSYNSVMYAQLAITLKEIEQWNPSFFSF